jgi:hypothetical protein
MRSNGRLSGMRSRRPAAHTGVLSPRAVGRIIGTAVLLAVMAIAAPSVWSMRPLSLTVAQADRVVARAGPFK